MTQVLNRLKVPAPATNPDRQDPRDQHVAADCKIRIRFVCTIVRQRRWLAKIDETLPTSMPAVLIGDIKEDDCGLR